MAQFDPLIIFSLLWTLVVILAFHYGQTIKFIVPTLLGIKKFREKKFDFCFVLTIICYFILVIKSIKFKVY
jgi:hypothetical protein